MRNLGDDYVRWGWAFALAYVAFRWGSSSHFGEAWILLPVCKWLIWFLLAVGVARVAREIGAGRLGPWRVLGAWTAALAAVVLVLVLARRKLYGWFDDPTWEVICGPYWRHPHDSPFADAAEVARRQAWVEGWGTGRVQALELAFVAVLAALNAGLATACGRRGRPVLAAVLSAVLTPALVVTWALGLGTLELTYDRLHYGVLSGALAVDLMYFLYPERPEDALAGLAYVAVMLANAALLRAAQKGERPAREKIARGARGWSASEAR